MFIYSTLFLFRCKKFTQNHQDVCRIFLSVNALTVCMAGCPCQYGLPDSLSADPCDAVLVEVEAKCVSDITSDTLTKICNDVTTFLTTMTTIDEK